MPPPCLRTPSGGVALRIGVTPFSSGSKRILKYHSSLEANGLTPRVIGCFGQLLDLGLPVRIGREACLVIAAQPFEDVIALALGILDGVMQIDEADALIHQLLHDVAVLLLDNRMTAAAVHVEDDGFGALEGLGVLRPAVARHHREDARCLLEHLHEQGAAGEEFMLAGSVALVSGDEDNLRLGRIGRLLLQRHAGLIVGIDISPEEPAGAGQPQHDRDECPRQQELFASHGVLLEMECAVRCG